MAAYIVMAIIAYAIGSVNFSVILSRKMAGFDLRDKIFISCKINGNP